MKGEREPRRSAANRKPLCGIVCRFASNLLCKRVRETIWRQRLLKTPVTRRTKAHPSWPLWVSAHSSA